MDPANLAMLWFPYLFLGEQQVLTFNMAAALPANAILTGTPVITVTCVNGGDPNPAALLNGAAELDPTGMLIMIPVTGSQIPYAQYVFKASCASTAPNVSPAAVATLTMAGY